MKQAIAIVNPVLMYVKYLLLTAVLIFSILSLVQYFFSDLNVNSSIGGSPSETLVPFLATAFICMFVASKIRSNKGRK
jgi:hypothetical protein